MQTNATLAVAERPLLYKPPGARTLAEIPSTELQQIRLGIQGFPGTGKTFAATTFPNTVFLNLDRGLGAHTGREDIIEVPIYDPNFVASCGPFQSSNGAPTKKEAFENWLKTQAVKLTRDQTLVIDGSTGLQNAYHAWYPLNKVYSRSTGKENEFGEWTVKKDWFSWIGETLKTLQCHVLYLCHEVEAKDKKTQEYTGKLRPLLTGAAGDEIVGHFTDWFRSISADKPTSNLTPEQLTKWGMNQAEFSKMLEQYPRQTHYFWQTEGSELFDGKCSSLVNFPRFIPASFESFKKYMRK